MSEVPCSQESSAGTRFTSRTSKRNTRFYSELEGRHSSFHVAPTHYSHTDACRMRRLLNLGRCSNVVHHRSVKSSPWLTQMVRPDGMRQATQRATKGEYCQTQAGLCYLIRRNPPVSLRYCILQGVWILH